MLSYPRYFHTKEYDAVGIDIEITVDGITTARNIRKMDENAIIIFVSSYDRYMMELFRLDVFAFVKKPIDFDSFTKTFLEANQKYRIYCISVILNKDN